MKTQMTDRARELLTRYEVDVRHSLAGRTDVDADDVVAGIREHVEAELARRGAAPATPATAEDVADALERLGPPTSWTEPAGEPDGAASAAAGRNAGRLGAILPAFGLILLGGVLVFTARWGALGWSLAIAGTLVLRVAGLPESAGPETTGRGVADRLALACWWLAAGFGAVVLLAAPAVLAWGAAQTGGILEEPLSAVAGERGAYWLATAAVAGLVSGAWWVFVGLALRSFGTIIRRALGPARSIAGPRTPRLLVVGGAFLCVAAVLCGIPLAVSLL